ncbi:MAG: ABC transporter substrate-binding protein [Pseudomonadota bacterium]
MTLRTTALAASFAALPLGAMAADLDTVTFQLDWLPGGDKSPVYVCIQEGICEKHGLNVEINGGRGSSQAITFLATGQSDIGTAGIEAVMAAVANEQTPVSIVASVFTQAPHAFYTLKSSGIDTLEEVAGKKVVTSPFSSSNVFLPLVLDEIGLTEDDVELVKSEPGSLGPMLMTGSADVMIAWMTSVTRYGSQAAEAGEELNVMPWSTGGLDLYGLSLVASDSFLEERPDVAARFVEAFLESLAFANENPERAAEAVTAMVPELKYPAVLGSVKDMLVLAFNDVTEADGLGALTPERLAQTWAWVAQSQGFAPDAIDPEAITVREIGAES